MVQLTFNDLLSKCDLSLSRVRLLRHQQLNARPGRSTYELWCNDRPAFERYQAEQSPAIRSKLLGTHWASFVVTPRSETLFVGLYRARFIGSNSKPIIAETTGDLHPPGSRDLYDVMSDDLLRLYNERIVIDWGNGTRAWSQRADRQEKLILEIRGTVP